MGPDVEEFVRGFEDRVYAAHLCFVEAVTAVDVLVCSPGDRDVVIAEEALFFCFGKGGLL